MINNPSLSKNLQNILTDEGGEGYFGKFLSSLIELFLIIAILAAFFLLVFGGIQWMLSGGDKAATEAARGRITSAMIGLLLVFAAWAIITLIQTFLGISILGETIVLPTIGPAVPPAN